MMEPSTTTQLPTRIRGHSRRASSSLAPHSPAMPAPELTHAPSPEAAANSLNPGSSIFPFAASRSCRLISSTAPSMLRLRGSLSASPSGRLRGDEGDDGSFRGGNLMGGDAARDSGTEGMSPNAVRDGVAVWSVCDEGAEGPARGRGCMGVIPNAARTECARWAWWWWCVVVG